jgi:hypothetical protein
MKIKFSGHQSTEREIDFIQEDQVRLFEIMRQEFMEHITYARFGSAYPTHIERQLEQFCNDYGVDVEYTKDRVAFFTALLKEMKFQ